MIKPKTLNGKPVVQLCEHGNGYWTVMVQRGENDYIVATWWQSLKSQWSWGHYDLTEDEANVVYDETCKRNAMRGNAQ
jgi:hypothetical protein